MENKDAEENFSTKQQKARQKARLSRSNGDEKRPGGNKTASSERTKASDSSALLEYSLSKEARLLKRTEFLRVYEQGRRIDGRFMTIFVLPNDRPIHRVGVTATKKLIGKAHDRNRCKRLLRESFRLSRTELGLLEQCYDWVLNARRSLLQTKLDKPLKELKAIVRKLATEDAELNKTT